MCISGCSSTPPPPPTKGPITCVKGCPNHPPYDPTAWNNPPVIDSTNCYAYASNDPNGHPPGKPQPGEHCGSPAATPNCPDVTRAAICDGMLPAPNPPPEKPGYYPVALVSDPDVDYHWYRLDNNGRWSHKPGNTAVTDKDASGNPITNPETANRNYGRVNYTDFCGYFYVPTSGVRTGP